MTYFFSDIPKGYDTHIDLATFLEILISISEYPICSAIEFLQYHDFQNKIKFYYLEDISYKPIELKGGEDIVINVFHDIDSNYPLTTRILTELPRNIMNKICNIYIDPIDLNKLDFVSKLGFDFTDKRRISDLSIHDYTDDSRIIDEKLSNLVLQFGLADKGKKPIQLPIDEIKTLVTHFHHQFVIKNNNLELVNQDFFMSAGNQLQCIETEQGGDENTKSLAELERELAQVKEQLKLQTKLAENQGYLDPNNKFFSIEMKLCHDTWNNLYKDGNNSHLAHGKQVANYLENHADLTVNTKAINRIKTITNPKRTLASGDADDDI